MKRQHCAITTDQSSLEVIDPFEKSIKSPSIQCNDFTITHEVMHPACLLRLSCDALSAIVEYVELPNILKLCASSPRAAVIISACTTRISWEALNLASYTRYVSHGLMRSMKQRGLFSNLRHLHVENHAEAGVEKWFSLSELPSSLTSLSLINVIINGERAFDGNTTPNLENLAGLTRLSIQSVAYSTIHGFSVTRWMSCLLAAPTHLVELTYMPREADDSHNDIEVLAASLPSTLESLTIYPVLLRALTPIYWPPNLTSLTVLPIQQSSPSSTSTSMSKVPLQIPATVTRLALIETLSVVCEVSPNRLPHVNKNLCLADPSQLRHLTIDWKSTARAGIMEAISSLICLEYLNLNRTLMHLNVDFRLMPRSLKTIKMAYDLHTTHWQHLPPNARYEDLLYSGDMSFKIVPSMDESYLQHLPRRLTHVEVHGGPLPCNLPVLEHVSFFLEQTATKDLCNTYMANLPRTLQSISASSSGEKDESIFWLHDGLNKSALAFESGFPLLSTMTVSSQCVPSPGALDAWLNHLPRTMTHLTLRLGVKQSTGDLVDTLDLSHVNLPPYLQVFNLSAYKTHLTMPIRIPASLRSIYLAILSLQNGPLLYQSIRGQILADDFLCLVNRRFVDLENLEYI